MNKTKRYNNYIVRTNNEFEANNMQFESVYIVIQTDKWMVGRYVANFKLCLN